MEWLWMGIRYGLVIIESIVVVDENVGDGSGPAKNGAAAASAAAAVFITVDCD